ncbi:MAG TPA: thiamine phosphate synthase [Pyrinomonadaceae bacterium]|nr:thiamine phosphate synthase [Pyrinomonadaceae bacterium]
MAHKLQQPILYLITGGETTPLTGPDSPEFKRILELVHAAAHTGIHLIQLREKSLPARVLFELAKQAAAITRKTETRLVINDRADIARSALCDGVHLTTRSLSADIVRKAFGTDFLVGVSAHSLEEAREARDAGADFAVFGPVFDTPSKRAYGPALGLQKLEAATRELSSFPLIAIGGITLDNAQHALRAGASGIAAIRLFGEPGNLEEIVLKVKGQNRLR